MMQAGRRGSLPIMRVLLEAGADPFMTPFKKQWNSFDFFMRRGSVESLQLLLEFCPDGLAYIAANTRRLLDNYMTDRLIPMLIFVRKTFPSEDLYIFTHDAISLARTYAEADPDFFATVAALLYFCPNYRFPNGQVPVVGLARHVLPLWSIKMHRFCTPAFRKRVFVTLLCLKRVFPACDLNVKSCILTKYALLESTSIQELNVSSSGSGSSDEWIESENNDSSDNDDDAEGWVLPATQTKQ